MIAVPSWSRFREGDALGAGHWQSRAAACSLWEPRYMETIFDLLSTKRVPSKLRATMPFGPRRNRQRQGRAGCVVVEPEEGAMVATLYDPTLLAVASQLLHW